jgi:putative glycosyltransferase (TIGR04348 family)
MKLAIATPAPPGSMRGNRRTALRYARLLREQGHTVRVVETWTRGDHDVLIALHASKGHASIRAFARAWPGRPIVLVLTGTDVYGSSAGDARARDSLRRATRVVTLQPEALRALAPDVRARARSILQSAESAPRSRRREHAEFRVVALAHLRAVKDPLLLADAVDALPASSRIVALHAGEALDEPSRQAARARSRSGSRWRWIGVRRHERALELLRDADAFVQSSVVEGGSLALAEAVVSGLPVLVTRIPAAVGMLGARHPGYFAVGDARALTRLLARIEGDGKFRAELRRASRDLAPKFSVARERAAWRALLAELEANDEVRQRAAHRRR